MMNEHEYIEYLILEKWWAEVKNRVHPIADKARWHLLNDEKEIVVALEGEADQLYQNLVNDRNAAYDRLHWLHLDTDLRSQGKTYPDIYEECSSEEEAVEKAESLIDLEQWVKTWSEN